MNVELLRKVQAHILEEPKRLIMDGWLETNLTPGMKVQDGDVNRDDGNKFGEVPQCGTIGCIGGWAKQLSGYNDDNFDVTYRELLDLPSPRLFFVGHWPEDFYIRYQNSQSQQERAQIVSDIIDYTIEHPEWLYKDEDDEEDHNDDYYDNDNDEDENDIEF